jgi:hypothetical protein
MRVFMQARVLLDLEQLPLSELYEHVFRSGAGSSIFHLHAWQNMQLRVACLRASSMRMRAGGRLLDMRVRPQ